MRCVNFENTCFQGISDHTIGLSAALYASAHGAKYLEKHFTFDKNLQKHNEKGHLGGMDAEDLKILKKITSEIELIGKQPNKVK